MYTCLANEPATLALYTSGSAYAKVSVDTYSPGHAAPCGRSRRPTAARAPKRSMHPARWQSRAHSAGAQDEPPATSSGGGKSSSVKVGAAVRESKRTDGRPPPPACPTEDFGRLHVDAQPQRARPTSGPAASSAASRRVTDMVGVADAVVPRVPIDYTALLCRMPDSDAKVPEQPGRLRFLDRIRADRAAPGSVASETGASRAENAASARAEQSPQENDEHGDADAELIPPDNFAMVNAWVYRSSFPKKKHFPFIKTLGLRSVLYVYGLTAAHLFLKTILSKIFSSLMRTASGFSSTASPATKSRLSRSPRRPLPRRWRRF